MAQGKHLYGMKYYTRQQSDTNLLHDYAWVAGPQAGFRGVEKTGIEEAEEADTMHPVDNVA